MTLLIGALTIGLILSLVALGVFVSFRVLAFQDLTVDGSITLGAAVAATLLVQGADPVWATVSAGLAGMLAGLVTGTLHTRFGISRLLSGILVMTALYSVNLHVMGKSNVPLLASTTLVTRMERAAAAITGRAEPFNLGGWEVGVRDFAGLTAVLATVVGVSLLLYWFFRTNLGTAMRATGDNDQMIRAMGVSDASMITTGLAVSNGLVALGGALLAQYQGFADVQMGIGMVVTGLASVIIGESLVGGRQLGLVIAGAIMGSVLFRLLVAIALRWGLNPNDLKLITALFVLASLIAPRLGVLLGRRRAEVARA